MPSREGVLPGSRQQAFLSTLSHLGLSELEARAYLGLVDGPRTAHQLRQEMRAASEDITEILGRLRRLGLVEAIPGRVPKFALASPQLALRGLVRRQEEQLEESRLQIQDLIQDLRSAEHGDRTRDYVELVTGLEALRDQFESFEVAAQTELLGCSRLPTLLTGGRGNRGESRSLEAGVINRWIYDRSLVEAPGGLDDIRYWVGLGEQARVSSNVPSKLFIADRLTALVHATETIDGEPTIVGIIIRHPEVVATLHRFFEALWAEAVPVLPEQRGSDEEASSSDDLVNYLLAGMTDASIARVLGLSKRTVARRVRILMEKLGAESRFQAGFRVAQQVSSSMNDEI